MLISSQPIATNPFATRFVRPGQISFVYPDGKSTGQLIEQFRANDFRGQIIGPHGSGKTTLIHSIHSLLAEQFDEIRHAVVRTATGNPQVKSTYFSRKNSRNKSLLIVDGVESLSWLNRWLLVASSQQFLDGLLVTAHKPLPWLPVLFRIEPQLETVHVIVQKLMAGYPSAETISRSDVAWAYRSAGGNIRETLMLLYDIVEKYHKN